MAERVLDRRMMELLASFEQLSGAQAIDMVESDERFVFLVPKDEVGRAVGKGGARLRQLRDKFGKNIDVVAFAEDPAELVSNYFRPYSVQEVKVTERRDGTRVARVRVAPRDKGRAIGKGGQNVKLCQELVARHTDVAQVVVDSGTVVTGA